MKRFKIVVVVLGSLLLAIMLLNGCIKPETTSHSPIPTEPAIIGIFIHCQQRILNRVIEL